MISLPLVRYVLRAALRDRLLQAFILLAFGACGMSLFVGGTAVIERQEFVTVYTSGSLRFLSVLAMTLFTAFFIQRSFDQRDVEFLLSRPLDRGTYIVSQAVALAVVAFFLALISFLGICVLSFGTVSSSYFLWGGSLFFEVSMVGFITLFFAMVFPSATVSTLAALGLYVLSRMIGQMFGIFDQHVIPGWGIYFKPIFEGISFVIPRFDLMTQSAWLLYGPQGHEGWLFLIAQAGAFSCLVLGAAVFDLKRRQF